MNKDQILHLASLARISLSEEEIAEFPKQFEGILDFISQIKDIDTSEVEARDFSLTNIMREDQDPHAAGEHRDAIIAEMPDTENDYLKVKKILTN